MWRGLLCIRKLIVEERLPLLAALVKGDG